MNEAPGPINFTMFLTMFGEKLNGTDPEDVIRNAFACFDEEGTGEYNEHWPSWRKMVYHHGAGIKHVHLHRCDPGGVPAGVADYDGWPVHRRRSWRALQGGAHWQERQLQLCSFHTHIKARCKGQRRLEVEVALDEVYPPLGVSFNEIPFRIIWRMTWSYDSWQASLCCSSLKFMYLSCFFDQNWLPPPPTSQPLLSKLICT